MPSYLRMRMAWVIVGMAALTGALGAVDTADAGPLSPGTELFSNPNFANATHDPTWPDDWRRKPGVTWQADAAPVAAGDAVPIRREGPHTIIGEGKPTVWFIHPYVDVVGHDFDTGITNLVRQAREQGHPLAVGVAASLDGIDTADEANTTYVFTYKNINYPLPEKAHRLVFLNTWLRPSVSWPALRVGQKDVVLIGSETLHNNGDGLAADKDRWWQIQKADPSLSLTVLDSTGYYLPISVWRTALLKILLQDSSK